MAGLVRLANKKNVAMKDLPPTTVRSQLQILSVTEGQRDIGIGKRSERES